MIINPFSISSAVLPILKPSLNAMASNKQIELSFQVDPRLLENKAMFMGDVKMINGTVDS